MNLFCVGLSHHTTNVETRESFAGNAQADCVLRRSCCAEALLLITCNRVEVYAAAPTRVPTEEIARCLRRNIDNHGGEETSAFYRYEGAECVQHLFRVTSGLDSMVVGETEILGQSKKAYESARKSGAAGQVRTHTEITRGSVSVGSVAVDLAEKIFGDLASCKVLLLGAGETSERTARALVSRGVNDLRISNRSGERAENLAQLVAARAVPFEKWPEQCREIDILITSTSSSAPLLARKNLAPILRQRIDRPLFIIDIAVPRDVDSDVNQLEGVYLYDIDSLQSIAEQSLVLRRQQIAAAEAIISRHVADFGESISGGLNRSVRVVEHPVSETSLRASEL